MANTTPQNPPSTPVKLLPFAFPFRKKGPGTDAASADFTDEHEFHELLRQEPSGAYSVSGKGMWHGGIHVTEAGAGASLDLKSGVRCIADGEVVAWRLNHTYPLSEMPAQNGNPAISAPYSTGFALVRHSMEFPKDSKLTFYSLYAHLQDFADYERGPSLPRPKYWTTRFEVTTYAQDRPTAGAGGQSAPGDQRGLRIRASKPHGAVLGILPQGAQVSIGKREGGWGQIKDASGVSLYPPTAGGFVQPSAWMNGWIFLGVENGGPVAKEVMPDSSLDQVVVLSDPAEMVQIKAGELIGHLGRYDSLSQQTSGNRMVHIEVFCDGSVKSFIDQGRSWISQNGAHVNAWQQLKLPGDPTILRIHSQTRLYGQPNQEGAEPKQTGVIEVFPLAALAKADSDHQFMETVAGSDGEKRHWWKVESADVRHQPIDGWVREQSFAGGRVTREFAQKWVDFLPLDDAHDPTHTMFATTQGFVDYSVGADVPNPGSLDKLSPLMTSIYQTLNLAGDQTQAADDLRNAANDPWNALRMSRLIIQHESEWANPDKWKQLIAAIETRTGPRPEHAEEQKRIEKLVWWDEVKAKLTDFPASNVFHIHPIGLVGNFVRTHGDCRCAERFEKIAAIILRHEGGYVNNPADTGGATNKGISWPVWQAHAQEDTGVAPTLNNLIHMTDEQAKKIYLMRYWEPRGFCKIQNIKTALMVYDWTITSGGAIGKVKKVLNDYFNKSLHLNSTMDQLMVDAINSVADQNVLIEKIAESRRAYYTALTVGHPSQLQFLAGWINRVNDCSQANIS
ncbi:chitinase (plasmid) [Paraburkholderia sprentiae WSM5005]|uniref:Chitinase n=2 Tax=Paraburkholderia sprentiae TaxID=948107 RepID=A0A8F4KIH9_9BURK|nr:chitinase [Paraburkholderia sprentiae WSM5005]